MRRSCGRIEDTGGPCFYALGLSKCGACSAIWKPQHDSMQERAAVQGSVLYQCESIAPELYRKKMVTFGFIRKRTSRISRLQVDSLIFYGI